jgi:anti-sigma factor RsiW
MTCQELASLLIDYVSGELSPEHRELLDHHLRLCPPCVTYLKTYTLTIKLSRQLPCEPLPPQLVEKLKIMLREMDQGRQGPCGLA